MKDLGKALGDYVIVVNCSEGLDYKSLGRMFSGLAQSGAWGCFDEFNRINIEVLSVVAQQILSILSAQSVLSCDRVETRMVFEGTDIRLRWSCGIFITMNPGYAGRTELPDNLKSMFRPISMMVPDSGMIAEIILFGQVRVCLCMCVFEFVYLCEFCLFVCVSLLKYMFVCCVCVCVLCICVCVCLNCVCVCVFISSRNLTHVQPQGFDNTRVLAKKVHTMYKLAVQQLSKQDHYDFGLRALVSILLNAGRKRQAMPTVPHEEILVLAMKDMNVAKMTANDLPLFLAIMSDLFPGVEPAEVDYGVLREAIESDLKEQGYQTTDITITKTIQLYETKNSR